jgi:hypothetical protein
MDNCAYGSVADAAWVIFSQINGNPELHMSATRFCLALFFLCLLYTTIRMRAMVQYKQHQIIALVGCVLMMVREASMLIFISGWELGVYTDPIIHFLWPPIEHFFMLLALACFSWYTIEASQWSFIRRIAHQTYKWFIGFMLLFSVYTLVYWKQFFTQHFPNVLYAYKDSPVDWQTHLLMATISLVGMLAAYMRRRGSSYLLWYWTITFLEHSFRTIIFSSYHEQAWQATIFHAMHIWAIPLLLLHFINAYVLKMSQCTICRQEVFLGKLYWETMHAPIKNTKE